MARDLTTGAKRRLTALFSTGGSGFRDLAIAQVTSAFGDTLVALALANTLFFSVPSAEARGNVALYLLLTIAPFAVIGPLLGAVLNRHPAAMKASLVGSSVLRAVGAVWGLWLFDGVWLFPVAFALLMLSRVHGIARNALLPVALDEPTRLVAANGRLATVAVIGGIVAAPIGFLVNAVGGATWGGRINLALAATGFAVAALSGRLLPQLVDDPDEEAARSHVSLPRQARLAQLATAVVRLMNGFLLFLLAFAFKDIGRGVLDLAAVLAAGGAGFAIAALTSPRLARRMREEPMVLAALAMEAAAAFIAAHVFGLAVASALAAAAGFAWGTAKLAFDGLLQESIPATERGAAFTRSETLFQLAWVIGAVIPTGIHLPTTLGLVIAGLGALTAQVVYVSNLIAPLRSPEG